MSANKFSVGHEMKAKTVSDLAEKIKNKKTLMIISIKDLPSKQFQEIKKKIRGDVEVKVAKKNIFVRTIKALEKESALKLESHINENCAFVLSDIDGFELAGILAQNKNPVFAKTGQIAQEDIEIQEGPTDLTPGPAISEFGALGIQIAVEDGKIAIKKSKVVVKGGEEIKENVASMLQKLNIQPFKVGLNPVAIYDIVSEKTYEDINIDFDEAKESLVSASGKSLGFAQKIVYYCKETIGYLLAKANAGGETLGKLSTVEEVEEKEAPSGVPSVEGKEKKEEGIIEKVEEKVKEIGNEIKEGVEKIEEGVEKVIEKISGEDVQLNKPEEKA